MQSVRKKYQHRGQPLTDYNAAPPALLHHLQYPKWPLGGPKIADRVQKGVYFQVFGRSCRLFQNKSLYPSPPCMRKVDAGGEKKGEIMLCIVATNVIASQSLQHRLTGRLTPCANNGQKQK